MRQHTQTFDEIQEAEEAAENRRRSRNQGFKKMHERDKGVQLLSNNAVMIWHVPKELNKEEFYFLDDTGQTVEIVVYPPDVPSDSFGLILDGKRYIFNLDEFRRHLRWA